MKNNSQGDLHRAHNGPCLWNGTPPAEGGLRRPPGGDAWCRFFKPRMKLPSPPTESLARRAGRVTTGTQRARYPNLKNGCLNKQAFQQHTVRDLLHPAPGGNGRAAGGGRYLPGDQA